MLTATAKLPVVRKYSLYTSRPCSKLRCSECDGAAWLQAWNAKLQAPSVVSHNSVPTPLRHWAASSSSSFDLTDSLAEAGVSAGDIFQVLHAPHEVSCLALACTLPHFKS